MNTFLAGIGTTVGVLLAVLLLFGAFTATVDAGQSCVVTTFGQIDGVAIAGIHLKWPWNTYHCFSIRELVYETSDQPKESGADYKDVTVDGQTSDGQAIRASYSVRFSVPPEKSMDAYRRVGQDMAQVTERVVKFYSRSSVRLSLQKYEAETLYSGDIFAVQSQIESLLKPLFADQDVDLSSFVLRKITFSDDYVKAVEAKQIAKQNITTQQYAAEAAANEAIKKKNLAKGDADAVIENARGDAESIRLRGEALRLHPEVLQYTFVQGLKNIPTIFLPSDRVVPFLPLPTPAPTK